MKAKKDGQHPGGGNTLTVVGVSAAFLAAVLILPSRLVGCVAPEPDPAPLLGPPRYDVDALPPSGRDAGQEFSFPPDASAPQTHKHRRRAALKK